MEEAKREVIDEQTGEIIEFTGPTVPMSRYRELEFRVQELEEQVEAEKRDRMSAHRRALAKQREIDDLLEDSADRETVLKILEWWRDRTGRGERTKLTLSGERAKIVRWLLRSWEPREVCTMVVGILNEPYWASKELSDWVHIATTKGKFSERKAEEFLELGRRALPPKDEA